MISKETDITQIEAEKRLSDLISIINNELLKENIVTFLNFGNFEVQKKNERITIHPSTGKKMLIPPKLTVKFRPSLSLNKKVKSIEP